MDTLPPPKPETSIVEPWEKKEEVCKNPSSLNRFLQCFESHSDRRESLASGTQGPVVFSNYGPFVNYR